MLEDPKSPPGELKFARSIPLEKARRDVLLAYKMNGEDLPPEHGFPVRAIVPGWYAMASVKWLQRIIVTDRPFTGYYQTLDYAYWQRREDGAELTPLSEMQIKAEIARPAESETVPANTNVRVYGAAWTCDAEITKVELSTDGGETWNDAKLLANRTRTHGDCGSSTGRHRRNRENKLSSPALPIRSAERNHVSRSRSRHLYDQSSAPDRESKCGDALGEHSGLACRFRRPRRNALRVISARGYIPV